MSPKAEQNLTVVNKLMIAWGLPIIVAMLSLITFFVHDIYANYQSRMDRVEKQINTHETRLTVLEYWGNHHAR